MAGGGGDPMKAIMYAFFANLGIAILKLVAFIYTGSSSMLAEAIHSAADTGNQLLLMLGLKRSKKPADAEHPLGYGKASFFWSFIVAIMLFSLGGLFSVYEGWHKLEHTGPVENAWVALTVLGLGILLEGGSLYGCIRVINGLRGDRNLWQWAKETRSAELVVVLGEDLGALLGLSIAMGFLSLAAVTGNGVYDAYGSISIGLVLLVIAVFLGIRVHSLLIGRSADPAITAEISKMIAEDNAIEDVFNVITVQMGPDLMLAAKVSLRGDAPTRESCEAINEMERRLKERFPQIRWSFVEVDIAD